MAGYNPCDKADGSTSGNKKCARTASPPAEASHLFLHVQKFARSKPGWLNEFSDKSDLATAFALTPDHRAGSSRIQRSGPLRAAAPDQRFHCAQQDLRRP